MVDVGTCENRLTFPETILQNHLTEHRRDCFKRLIPAVYLRFCFNLNQSTAEFKSDRFD